MIPTYEDSRSAYIDGTATPMQEFIYLHRDAFRNKEWFERFSTVIELERETARQEGHNDCLEVLRRVQEEQHNLLFQKLTSFSLPKPDAAYLKTFFVNVFNRLSEIWTRTQRIEP